MNIYWTELQDLVMTGTNAAAYRICVAADQSDGRKQEELGECDLTKHEIYGNLDFVWIRKGLCGPA